MSKRFIPTRNSPIENERGSVPGLEFLPPPQYSRWNVVSAMKWNLEL
jgi:hypothetical protein